MQVEAFLITYRNRNAFIAKGRIFMLKIHQKTYSK